MKELNQVWDLDVLFPGGSRSPQYNTYLDELEAKLSLLAQAVDAMENENPEEWGSLVEQMQDFTSKLRHAAAFVSCLTAQDSQDRPAQLLGGRLRQMRADYSAVTNNVEKQMLQITDAQWDKLLTEPRLAEVSFTLNEMRMQAKVKMCSERENLAGSLAVDGYHAWGELYNSKIVSSMSITVEEDGQEKELSIGQAANRLTDSDRNVRRDTFIKYEEAWTNSSELCSAALNHLAGFRLNLYKKRGWDSFLKEPLMINRMSAKTLDAMWHAVQGSKPKLVKYLKRKAELLGLDGLEWYDVSAPVGESTKTYSYEEAARFIVDHFGRFSSELAELATTAFENRWIESENRAGKRPGAFCTYSPQLKQSRVFMTFDGSASNVSTLAHELGHAYHGFVLRDLPAFSQRYAMNVAETASTFAEMVVSDAAIRTAQDDQERLALLANKIEQNVAMFMNIHARFLFETRFYERRRSGLLGVEELNNLMEDAQREAYSDALLSYHPQFWASKLHFYSTGVPFYNFPYTFGHLLSTGVYLKALEEGADFSPKYRAFLQDTGQMTVEDLVMKHLGEDLTKTDFWEQAVTHNLADVDTFLELSKPTV